MGSSNDEDPFLINPIQKAIRKSLQKISPVFAGIDGPEPWKFLNPAQCLLNLIKKFVA